jgi:hypothetical protein
MKKRCSENWDHVCDRYLDNAPLANGDDVVRNSVKSFYQHHRPDEDDQPFNKKVIDLCSKRPGLCDDVLKDVCQYTRDNVWAVKRSPRRDQILDICGCFLQDIPGASQYNRYGGQIPKECDPMCVASKIQPGHNEAGVWTSDECQESNCIIDDQTIKLIEDPGAPDITINQTCSNKGNAGNFNCFIGDQDINSVKTNLPFIKICQSCKGDVKVAPLGGIGSGAWVDAGCPASTKIGVSGQSTRVDNIWIILIAVLIFLLIILCWNMRKKSRK